MDNVELCVALLEHDILEWNKRHPEKQWKLVKHPLGYVIEEEEK